MNICFDLDGAGFTLIVKYGERGLATKCSRDFSRKELVPLLMAKWNGINKDDVFLSYELLGVGGNSIWPMRMILSQCFISRGCSV